MPFRDVLGHRRLVELLSRSIERDSIPPSLIFAGPSGIGKRLVALSCAQTLNCLEPRLHSAEGVPYDACGVCSACTRIARGLYPDVVEVKPGDSGSIKIEPIRDILEQVGYRPFEGRRRVVIVDEADALVAGAQNALLKTLEEPPSSVVFILVSARPDLLLPTVRSRCMRLRFQQLDPPDVAAWLIRTGESETSARAIAALANGSIGAAKDVRGEESVEARDDAVNVLTELASTDNLGRRLEAAGKGLLIQSAGVPPAAQREYLAARLQAIESLLRDAVLVSVNGDAGMLANPDMQDRLGRLTAFKGERGAQAFAAVDEALVAIDRNQSVKIIADWIATHL